MPRGSSFPSVPEEHHPMLDCAEKHLDLEARVEALEEAIVSGVPQQSIATRFETQYTRISEVGQNINARIGREVDSLRAQMKAGFAAVDERFEKIDLRFERVDERFQKIDLRFEQIDARFQKIDERFEQIDERLEQIDVRFEKMDERLENVEKRLDTIETLLVRIDAKLGDDRSN
ncbi:hypothetical protein [[Actinomadura] parvosata]|uniref:hypothetical protein n=1 Tax=[Actinomadura] parvosata TaxID=1955412 RepID=UPI0012BBEA55|nr:hypothetical protein [Nonomuraea sp. ATCC 55076]